MIMHLWKHFKTVCKHRWVVFRECARCGIPWRGLVHDLSKFSPEEFIPSAKHFQGTKSPIEAEKDKYGYSKAWLHHKGHNKHHWEYWTDFDRQGKVVPVPIPVKYVIEMVCDWVGAGMVYNKGNWTQEDPLKYYNKVRAGRHFEEETERDLVNLLTTIQDDGLVMFHKVCRLLLKRGRNL